MHLHCDDLRKPLRGLTAQQATQDRLPVCAPMHRIGVRFFWLHLFFEFFVVAVITDGAKASGLLQRLARHVGQLRTDGPDRSEWDARDGNVHEQWMRGQIEDRIEGHIRTVGPSVPTRPCIARQESTKNVKPRTETTDGDHMKGYDPNDSPAAMAPNWRRVILVDGLLGIVVAIVGIVLAITWSSFGGAVIAAFGVLYLFAVIRRVRGFGDRRRAAGLDD